MWTRKYLMHLLQRPNFLVADGISLRIPRGQFSFWRNNNDDGYCCYNDFFHQESKYFINQSFTLVYFQGENKALYFSLLLTKFSRLKLKHILMITFFYSLDKRERWTRIQIETSTWFICWDCLTFPDQLNTTYSTH